MASRTRRKTIDEFLALKRIAVVGVSRDEKSTSRALYRELRGRGYDVVPVNPNLSDVEGDRCFARLQDVRPPVEGALLMTRPEVTEKTVFDCAEVGVKRVWMYRGGGQGAVSEAALGFCRSRKIDVVAGECPFMFLPEGQWVHRAHGFIRKITGRLPA